MLCVKRINIDNKHSNSTPHFNSPKTSYNLNAVSFEGINNKIMGGLVDMLPDKKAVKFLNKIKWLQGEIGGVLITAVGTGVIAPIILRFNPFLKAPKDATIEEKTEISNNKKITAFREPISAALAIIIEAGALKPIDKFLDIVFNNPKYSKNVHVDVDQSVLNNDSYIEKQVKKQMKSEGILYKTDSGKEILEERIEKIKEAQLKDVAEYLQKTGKIKVGERFIDDKDVATFINKTIDYYIANIQKMKYSTSDLSFYVNRARVLLKNDSQINDIYYKMPKIENKEFLLNEIRKTSNSELKEILVEIAELPQNMRYNKMENTVNRIKKLKNLYFSNKLFTDDDYLNYLMERNIELDKRMTKLNSCKINNPSTANAETIKETVDKIVKACQFTGEESDVVRKILLDTDILSTNEQQVSANLHKDISKFYKSMIENKYRGYNQLFKVLIGVCITLPIAVTTLNWVYPRVLDKFFPHLVSGNKSGGDK